MNEKNLENVGNIEGMEGWEKIKLNLGNGIEECLFSPEKNLIYIPYSPEINDEEYNHFSKERQSASFVAQKDENGYVYIMYPKYNPHREGGNGWDDPAGGRLIGFSLVGHQIEK